MSSHPAAVHSVHIYDHPTDLIIRLCGIVSSSLRVGDSVLIVATPEHRDQLVRALRDADVNVRMHARDGRFVMFDAKEALATFMRDGKPDRHLFACSVGHMLKEIQRNARSKTRRLTVFGEMVALLWDESNKQGALELEALWNDTLNNHAFHLHCAYARGGFVNDSEEIAVCRLHSHMWPDQSKRIAEDRAA